jgi:hypothetical protein
MRALTLNVPPAPSLALSAGTPAKLCVLEKAKEMSVTSSPAGQPGTLP